MPTTIKLKNSVTTTNAPTSLAQGEVAINVTDKKVWVGNAATTPVLLLGSGADGTFTNLTVSGVASFADGTVSLPSITNIGDTNTGIFFPAADTIAFTEGGVEAMRINSSAYVGIGTTTPATKLVVKGTHVGGEGLINIIADSGTQFAALSFTNNVTQKGIVFHDNTNNLFYLYGAAGQGLAFNSNDAERMRITSAGDVGIGTSSPTLRLSVNGDIWQGNGSGTEIGRITNNSGWYDFAGNSSNVNGTQMSHGSTVRFLTASTERMRINSAGDVMVGTTINYAKLCVAGTSADANNGLFQARSTAAGDSANCVAAFVKNANDSTTSQVFIRFGINGYSAGCGQINANGATQAAFGAFSDSRLKENIEDLPSQLANITALRPVEFDYIESEGGGHQIGFIAQEMQEVYPDAVGKREDGMLTVTGWNKTEARLVKAIQEQQALIENLTTRLNALEGK